jgi:elongation factor 2
MEDLLCVPTKGNVCFGSGKDVWGFTLTKFARIYAKKFGTEMEKLRERLWGDNFYHAKEKKWKKEK